MIAAKAIAKIILIIAFTKPATMSGKRLVITAIFFIGRIHPDKHSNVTY